jgi:hypothetical protein
VFTWMCMVWRPERMTITLLSGPSPCTRPRCAGSR